MLSDRNQPHAISLDEKGYNGLNAIYVIKSPIRCKTTPPNPAENPMIYQIVSPITVPNKIQNAIPATKAKITVCVIVLWPTPSLTSMSEIDDRNAVKKIKLIT